MKKQFLVVSDKRDYDKPSDCVFSDPVGTVDIKSALWLVEPGLIFGCANSCPNKTGAGIIFNNSFVPFCDVCLSSIMDLKMNPSQILKKRFSILKAPQLVRRRFEREVPDLAVAVNG